MALQPGMAFRPHADDPEVAFMCLASLKWGVLAWPLAPRSMETWALDTCKEIEWKFLFDVSGVEAAETIPTLDSERGVEVRLGDWEPLLRATLRLNANRLTVQELSILATLGVGMTEQDVNRHSKSELVKEMALKVGDEDFANLVASSLQQHSKKCEEELNGEDDGADDSELANMLFEMLDPSELSEFLDMKKDVKKKEQIKKTRQWKQWQKEAEDVSWIWK